MGLAGKKKLKASSALAPVVPAKDPLKPIPSTISMSISAKSTMSLQPKEEQPEKTKPKEEQPEKTKPKEENPEAPKLDLADASVLGITTVKLVDDGGIPSPPAKTHGKNAAKVAKIIHDHLIHKQAVATYNLLRNFRPVQLLLLSCGLFPLQFTKDNEGIWIFNSSLAKRSGICFLVSSAFIVYIALIGTLNMLLVEQDVPIFASEYTDAGILERKMGRILLDRHVMIMIIIWLALVQNLVAVIVMFFRRKKFADHFTDWSEKLLLIQMDMTSGTFLSACVTSLTFIGILAVFTLMALSSASASTVGGPLCIGMLMMRNFLPFDWITPVHIDSIIPVFIRLVGLVFTILIFVSSKAPLLFFVHKCKLLKNGFALWNARLYNATLQSADIQQTKEGRTTYGILYEDYFSLLRLKEDMDKLFAGIIEIFLCFQSISVCCELYLTLRSMKQGHDQKDAAANAYFIRPYDWIPGMSLFVVSIMFLHTVSMNAIELGEEIQSGLEIIRRSTMLGKKKEEELFFMASLFTNYTEYNYGTNFLEGLGFFYFDRETHGAIIGLSCALFMIVWQFQPLMDFNTFQNGVEREDIGRFLRVTEGLSDKHWLVP